MCVSVCQYVCPAFTAYISVRLIVLKFHCATPLKLCARVKGVKKFFAFLCVSEHFESIETRFFFFENFREREAQNARERSEQDASVLNVSKFHKKNHSHL